MTGIFDRVSTGNAGLDLVLGGGLPAQRLYLVEGAPGSGKTPLPSNSCWKGLGLANGHYM